MPLTVGRPDRSPRWKRRSRPKTKKWWWWRSAILGRSADAPRICTRSARARPFARWPARRAITSNDGDGPGARGRRKGGREQATARILSGAQDLPAPDDSAARWKRSRYPSWSWARSRAASSRRPQGRRRKSRGCSRRRKILCDWPTLVASLLSLESVKAQALLEAPRVGSSAPGARMAGARSGSAGAAQQDRRRSAR